MSTEPIAMQMLQRGDRGEAARAALADALPDARVGEPDEFGIFEIEVDAADREAALKAVWNAVAASGAEDRIAFAEHPDIPEHWRSRGDTPGG